jgi:hypothetical protein
VFPPSKVGEDPGTLFDRCSTGGSPSSAKASAPVSPLINQRIEFAIKLANVEYRQAAKSIGAVRTRAATSDSAHLKMEWPPKVSRAAVSLLSRLPPAHGSQSNQAHSAKGGTDG